MALILLAPAVFRTGLQAGGPIVVNTLSDTSTSGDGQCSLREAINNANAKSDTTSGDCAPGTGNDSINFSVSGTIKLVGSALPAIQNILTIDGTGQAVTVDAQGAFRVFAVNPYATFNLNSLTVANGNAGSDYGGGVDVNVNTLSANLTVRNCTFSGNAAASGGGIFNRSGTVTVADSTFTGGKATGYAGGGVYTDGGGTLVLSGSTFSGNTASSFGGAVYNDGGGDLTLTNNTFFGNSASSGGALLNNATLALINNTFSGNTAGSGGAIFEWPTHGVINVRGCILSNNVGGNCSGASVSGAYNISDDSTCGFGASTGASGQTIGDNVNPLLDPNGLQNNGGPTQTIALQASSPAIDAVPIAQCPGTDQRGATRPDAEDTGSANPACDTGAFESALTSSSPSPTPTPTPTLAPGQGFTSISAPLTAVSDFITNFPTCSTASDPAEGYPTPVTIGPTSMLFDGTSVFVTDVCNGTTYQFSPVGALVSQKQNGLSAGFALSGSTYYGISNQAIPFSPSGPGLYELFPSNNLSIALVASLPGIPPGIALNTAADPMSSDLYVSSNAGLFRVQNPGQAGQTVTNLGLGPKGIVYNQDGSVFYTTIADSTLVLGFDRTGTLVFQVNVVDPLVTSNSPLANSNVEGIAVAQNYALANGTNVSGNLFVTDFNGDLIRIDTNNGNAASVVASGGSPGPRGAGELTVGPDGCLYVAQSGRVQRMSPCFFPFAVGQPNTSTGSGVTVSPGSATLSFSSVTSSGTTTVTQITNAPPPPSGYVANTYLDISTTTIYTGPVTVCLDYSPPGSVSLFHYQNNNWVNVTVSNTTPLPSDPNEGQVCGEVNSLSPFVIARPAPPPPPPGGGIGGFGGFPTPQPTPVGASGSQVTVSPQRLGFSMTAVGGASAPLSATLTNSSRFAVQVYSVTTNSAGFAETDNCVGTLGPHRSCAVNVVFSPTAGGAQTATLKIADSTNSSPQGAAQYPHAVALIGTGTSAAQKVTAAPEAISFAPQKAGTTSGSRMVTLSNNQSAVLHIGGVSASSNFVVTTNRCGSSLAANASCTINVAFAPTSHGELTGSLTIANDGTTRPLTVALSGAAPMPTPTPTPSPKITPTPQATPTPSPAPAAAALAITPHRLSFGKRAIGANASEAKARYVVLFNPGNRKTDPPITIKRVSASDDFGIPANACVGALAPGERCKVPVYFIPRGAGVRRGVLAVESDASSGSQSVRLSGTGVEPKQ